jgi:DNA invertase Pin-like site-specific DNA recombinase
MNTRLGEYNEHMRTQARKVRAVCFYGTRNGNAKLNADQVRRIRNLYAAGNETCRSLAERFGVSPKTVYNVIERVIWRGVAV